MAAVGGRVPLPAAPAIVTDAVPLAPASKPARATPPAARDPRLSPGLWQMVADAPVAGGVAQTATYASDRSGAATVTTPAGADSARQGNGTAGAPGLQSTLTLLAAGTDLATRPALAERSPSAQLAMAGAAAPFSSPVRVPAPDLSPPRKPWLIGAGVFGAILLGAAATVAWLTPSTDVPVPTTAQAQPLAAPPAAPRLAEPAAPNVPVVAAPTPAAVTIRPKPPAAAEPTPAPAVAARRPETVAAPAAVPAVAAAKPAPPASAARPAPVVKPAELQVKAADASVKPPEPVAKPAAKPVDPPTEPVKPAKPKPDDFRLED